MLKNSLFLSLIIFLAFGNIQANEEAKKVNASLSEATVFFNGAELIHKASSTVTKGVNEIWITELSPNIDLNSLKISTTKGVIVASHEYSLDFITKKEVSRVEKTLKDSIKYYEDAISEYEISYSTNNDLLSLLKANKSIGGSQTGLKVSELAEMVAFYKTQSNTLNRAQKELEKKTEKADKERQRIQAQLRQESAKNTKSVGVLKLNLTSPLATSTDFTITYFTKSANWIPYYDINVAGTDEQIKISSKAKVAQTTGLDWNKVKLSLSTATPSSNKEAPLFDAWFLDYKQQYNGYNVRSASSGSSQAMTMPSQNSHSYNNDELNKIRGELMGDMNEMIDLQPEIDRLKSRLNELNNQDTDSMRQLRSQLRKLTNAQNEQYADDEEKYLKLATLQSMTDYVDRSEGELSAIYNIDLPYTILGNGKIQNIDLQTNLVSADFKHYSVPKLDTEVFVLAEIADWQSLGLLSGKANVTFDGTYVGETVINATSIAKKLTLTLGTDKRVTVKRENLQDYSSQKFLGRDTQQDFTYRVTVKNNQNKPIKMVLKDQYPLSNQKDIQIELLKETTPTTHVNEEVGVLVWEFELNAGETKEHRVAYRVKYPKDKNLTW